MTEPHEVVARDEVATRAAGRELAARVAAGEVVLLEGELGAGKTVFVRGLAEGLGADPDEVASPTFALVHEYGPSGSAPVLLHADLYRLAENDASVAELGILDALQRGAVVAIEWPRPPFTELPGWRVEIREGPAGRLIRVAPTA